MASLAETLLRTIAPIQQGRLERAQTERANAAKLAQAEAVGQVKKDVAGIQGQTARDVGAGRDASMENRSNIMANAQRDRALSSLMAAREHWKNDISKRNDPDALAQKLAASVMGIDALTARSLQGNPTYQKAMAFALKKISARMPPEDAAYGQQQLEQSNPGFSQLGNDDSWAQDFDTDPQMKAFLLASPEMQKRLDEFKRSKMPATPLQPLGQPPVTNSPNQPNPGTSVTQPSPVLTNQPQGGGSAKTQKKVGQSIKLKNGSTVIIKAVHPDGSIEY